MTRWPLQISIKRDFTPYTTVRLIINARAPANESRQALFALPTAESFNSGASSWTKATPDY
jgi:hypothetical protein